MTAIPKKLPFPDDGQYRIPVEQYHEMIRAGIFTEDDPIELIEGVLVFKMPKNKPHVKCTRRVTKVLTRAISNEYFLQAQDPVTLSDSEPEPDFVVIREAGFDDLEWHATPEFVALIIEVADSSLSRDRGTKLRMYARAGIAHYWIINLIDRVIEVYEDPKSDIAQPTYAPPRIVRAEESITLPAIVGGASIKVADLLP